MSYKKRDNSHYPSSVISTNNTGIKDKEFILILIINKVENGTGKSARELKEKYSEEMLFYIALKYVTTTKKALIKALNLNVDNCCRFKRRLQKEGRLEESTRSYTCPYTQREAKLISTNRELFDWLNESDNPNQLSIFDYGI